MKPRPDRTEAETWAEFQSAVMAKEGECVTARLFQSGSNTYRQFREAGSRPLEAGDLPCRDTDAIGFENCVLDFSRTFLCGRDRATGDQRMLCARASDKLETNAGFLAPGCSFAEIARKGGRFRKNTWQADITAPITDPGMSGE